MLSPHETEWDGGASDVIICAATVKAFKLRRLNSFPISL